MNKLDELDKDTLERLIREATYSADLVATNKYLITSDLVGAAVRRAIEMSLANGLVTLTPIEDWPERVSLDPPYGMEL